MDERETIREDAGIGLVRAMLGALFLSQFWENLHDGNYTVRGYRRLVTGYADHASSPAAWQHVERFVADHASVFFVLQAAGELVLGIALVLALLRPLVALMAAGLLGLLWLSELGLHWSWELPPAIFAALAIALSHAGWFRTAGARARLLGPPSAGRATGLAAIPLGGLLVAGLLAANDEPTVEAWRTGLSLALALAAAAALDRVRRSHAPGA